MKQAASRSKHSMAMLTRNEATTSRHSRRLVAVLLLVVVVHIFTVVADHGDRRRGSTIADDGVMLHWRQRRTPGAVRDGPPIKPEHFRSVAELNKYLADLNEYYTVLGRPRSVRLVSLFTSSSNIATSIATTADLAIFFNQ